MGFFFDSRSRLQSFPCRLPSRQSAVLSKGAFCFRRGFGEANSGAIGWQERLISRSTAAERLTKP